MSKLQTILSNGKGLVIFLKSDRRRAICIFFLCDHESSGHRLVFAYWHIKQAVYCTGREVCGEYMNRTVTAQVPGVKPSDYLRKRKRGSKPAARQIRCRCLYTHRTDTARYPDHHFKSGGVCPDTRRCQLGACPDTWRCQLGACCVAVKFERFLFWSR